jgi:hypothetical protein
MSKVLSFHTNALYLARVFAAAPHILERNMEHQISRVIKEMARTARKEAPKAMSGLVTAIKDVMVSAFEGQVVAGKDYAQAVEDGTGIYGPSGQASGKMPPKDNILDWMRVTKITPRDPSMSEDQLEFLIARKIATQGTPEQPFMAPALEENTKEAERRIDLAIQKTLQEIVA